VVIPGAYHKFDLDDQKKVYGRALQRSKAECPIEVDISTLYVYDRTPGKRVQGDELRDLLKNSCSATGATVQGWLSARDKADKAALAFLKKVYGQ
jgi:hypothetical protein